MKDIVRCFEGKTVGILGMGYVGTRLCNLLCNVANIRVFALNRNNLQTIIETETFDYFFNCAGNTGDFRTQIDETIASNLLLNQFLVKHLKIKEAFIYLSSTRVYGFSQDKKQIFDEEYITTESHTNIDFIYNGTKKLTESYLLNKSTSLEYKVLICRLSNIFGDYKKTDLDDSTYIKVLVKRSLTEKSIFIKQSLDAQKDYIFIEDALYGIFNTAVNSPKSDYFNIASGQSYSLRDWLTYLDLSYQVVIAEPMPLFSNISIEKAKNTTGFLPAFYLHNLNKQRLINNE